MLALLDVFAGFAASYVAKFGYAPVLALPSAWNIRASRVPSFFWILVVSII